ncbi:MAG: amidohydrolase [Deltaproteobacteria bacterium]|nr:amidohydrolase [Deltaproteobacteria bacterium]
MPNQLDKIIEGHFLTMSVATPTVAAVGIKDGIIVETGSVEDLQMLANSKTQHLDLTGRTILPGFIDTHVHPAFTGKKLTGLDVETAGSVAEIIDRITARVSTTPAEEVIYATGFNYPTVKENRLPTLSELDALSSEHAIAIHVIDGHSIMLNSKLLAQMDFPPGTEGVVVDGDGNPTGLVEDPAIALLFSTFTPTDEARYMELIQVTAQAALAVGVTTAHMKEPPEAMAMLLANEADLPIRVKPFYLIPPDAFNDIDSVLVGGEHSKRSIIGIIADGAPDSKTAAYFEPYPDDASNFGVLFSTDEELMPVIEKAHRAGYQVSVHTCGCRATEQVLQLFETVLQDHPRPDHRHRFEHFETASEAQLRRIVKLGLSASMHPQHTNICEGYSEYMSGILPKSMSDRMIPLRSLLDSGMLIGGGSDSPVAPMAPLTSIQDCLIRQVEKHCISLYEALRMFTVDAARLGFEENLKGTIEKGKVADFAVLADDPFQVPVGRLKDIDVVMTIVGGKVMYENK